MKQNVMNQSVILGPNEGEWLFSNPFWKSWRLKGYEFRSQESLAEARGTLGLENFRKCDSGNRLRSLCCSTGAGKN